jgi:hypothetical protein
VRQNFGSRSGISHFQLPEHAPMVEPSQIAITMVWIFRIPRASCLKLRRGCDSFVPAWRFAALQTGRTLFLGESLPADYPSALCRRCAAPLAVSTIREDFIPPLLSTPTKPSRTAFSQIGMRGQLLRHASMVSA